MIENTISSCSDDSENEERDEIDRNVDLELTAMFDDSWKDNMSDEHANEDDEIKEHFDDNDFMTNESIEREMIVDDFQRSKI